jgi:hypothetical protein
MISANLHGTVRFEICHFRRPGRAVIASLLTGLVLLLNILAASPSLHQRFHADAGKAEHQCAVTLFAHSQVDSAAVQVAVPSPLTVVAPVSSLEISVFHPAIEYLPAGRAPPVASFHS